MFPKRFFCTRMFADRFYPQSQGEAPPIPPDDSTPSYKHFLFTNEG